MKPLSQSAAAFALLAAVGCEPDAHPCNPDVRANEAFLLTVGAPSDPEKTPLPFFLSDLPTCALDDVHVDDMFDLVLTKHTPYGRTCYHYVCPQDFPTSARENPEGNGRYGLNYVCADDQSKVRLDDGCEVGRFVGIYNPGTAVALYETPGHPNEHTLVRALSVLDEASCPGLADRYPTGLASRSFVCADQWQVRLTEQKD